MESGYSIRIKPITWKWIEGKVRYSGFVDGVEFFICKQCVGESDKKKGEWKLISLLPLRVWEYYVNSVEECNLKASVILGGFVKSLIDEGYYINLKDILGEIGCT